MPRHAPLPAPFDRGAFRVGIALAAGLTTGRMRGGDLARPFHGVRAIASDGIVDAIGAYGARMPAEQFFSHWTAAGIHRLPTPRSTHGLHVTAIAPARTPRVKGVTGHSISRAEVCVIGGLRVSSPVQTWVDMSTELSHRDLVTMGDALVRRKQPIATLDQLSAAVLANSGRRGAANLSSAFARVRARTDSVQETYLRLAIVDFGLPEPEVNIKILDARGRFIAWGDLGYPQFRVLAEYDGEQHRTDEAQFFRDVDRLDDIAEERWRVVRFNKSHVSRQRLLRLQRALISAGWRP